MMSILTLFTLAFISGGFLYEKADFPQCHAPTIVEYPAGELVAAFFGGTNESNDDVCIYLCRKKMSDSVWTAPVKVAEDSLHACWNPVLFAPGDGRLLLFYKTGPCVADWTGHLKTSFDGGLTWPEEYTFPSRMLGAIKDKPVKLPSGRIISPSSEEFHARDGEQPEWTVHFEISDDNAATWRKVGPVEADDTVYVIQPTLVEHRDGTIQALLRSANGKIGTTFSRDEGEHWSKVDFLDYPNNNSGIDAVTLPDGTFAMVCNPVGENRGARYPLCLAVSSDGKNWKNVLTLESEPCRDGYCYPSMIVGSDGALHIVYTWNRTHIKYARVIINGTLPMNINDSKKSFRPTRAGCSHPLFTNNR